MISRAPSDERAAVSLAWLVRLRWGTVAGQAAAVGAAAWVVGPSFSAGRLLALVGLLAVSNLALARLGAPAPGWACGAALTFDALLLTALLQATGGPSNPFSILYLVYITLAAVVLGARWTWLLTGLSVACYGLLFVASVPLEHLGHQAPEMRLHLQGMWAAFCVAAVLTAYFVVQMSRAIERHDTEMAEMRDRAARNERLASLATLAAGAAHELGTPLATIAVAAGELELAIRKLPGSASQDLHEDAALIVSELERCRTILGRLGAQVGETPGEDPVPVTPARLLAAVLPGLTTGEQARVKAVTSGEEAVRVPLAALSQAVNNLLRNALDAGAGHVGLSVASDERGLRVVVADDGPGLAPEVLARVGEPFFSTKPKGAGLGLGVFIARSLSEQMGGGLEMQSTPGRGTTAVIAVPAGPGPERRG